MWSTTVGTQDVPFRWPLAKEERRVTRPRYVVTDASEAGWGYIIGDWDGETFYIRSVDKGRWAGEDKSHIFLKELEAALIGLKNSGHAGDVIVVGDNVAVSWALRQGYTRNITGMSLIAAAATNRIVEVVTVISADNPADSPSRNKAVDPARTRRLEAVLRGRDRGEVRASLPRSAWSPDECARQIRHGKKKRRIPASKPSMTTFLRSRRCMRPLGGYRW